MESIKRSFIWMSILLEPDERPIIKYRNVIIGISLFTAQTLNSMYSAALFFEFLRFDLELALYDLIQVITYLCGSYMMFIGYYRRLDIAKLFVKIQAIRNDYPSNFIEAANQRGEKIANFFVIHSTVSWIASNALLAILSYVYCLIVFGQSDFNYLFYPQRIIVSWNQQTHSGWIVNNIIGNGTGGAYLLVNGTFLAFFILVCEYHQAFYKYFCALIDQCDGIDRRNHHGMELQLQKSIHFCISAKDLFEESADVFSVFIPIQLITYIIILSASIFQVDLAINNTNLTFFLMMFVTLVIGITLLLYCLFGHFATDCYLDMADRLYESKWYDQPIDLQKYFILMIQNAQRPFYYHGFGMAFLNLNTFLKILKTIASYYMMFKTLTADH